MDHDMLIDPERLNADCACISLDRDILARELDAIVGEPGFGETLAGTHPTLLSSMPVFLRPDHVATMAAIVEAVELVARLPAYQEAVLGHAPAIARHDSGAVGVLMGYDFHLGESGPKLIEINTNAGGALINAVVTRAQASCCREALPFLDLVSREHGFETAVIESFKSEWRRAGHTRPLATVAIVDEEPERQYLYPEFVLFRRLFERHGIEAVIASPLQLTHAGGRLSHGARAVDLVYNRLTDFSLETPQCAALRAAYVAGDAVVTPNPRAHALLADKRNLALLTDAALLRGWGIPGGTVDLLARGIPRTVEVTGGNAQQLWRDRARLFFKPFAGYASKAAYRGDKVTKRVWETIAAGGYVAQELVAPSSRTVTVDGERQTLKVDIRNYTYDGAVQLIAARLYQGQTTNMRTPGGGFAPVLWHGAMAPPDCCPQTDSAAPCCDGRPDAG